MTTRSCDFCGQTYRTPTARLRFGRGITCSRACGYALRGAKTSARLAGSVRPEAWVDRTCQRCGVAFRVTKSHDRRFCGRKCANNDPEVRQRQVATARLKARKPSPPWTDEQRAAAAQRARDQWADPARRASLVAGMIRRSADPAWRASRQFRRGAAHPGYRGNKDARHVERARYRYKAWHRAVLVAANFTCARCGVRGGRLEAHHIKHWATHPAERYVVANGQALCRPCHRAVHT